MSLHPFYSLGVVGGSLVGALSYLDIHKASFCRDSSVAISGKNLAHCNCKLNVS